MRSTLRCRSTSPGAPSGRPMMWRVITARGSFMVLARKPRAPDMMTTVGMPASSSMRATCPTDTWQIGQTGTSSMASTARSLSMATQRGACFFNSGICAVAPTKENASGRSSPISPSSTHSASRSRGRATL